MKEFGPILYMARCKPQILFHCFETTDQQNNNKTVQCSYGQELRGLVSSSTFILLLYYMLWSQGKQILIQYICVRSVVYLRNPTQLTGKQTIAPISCNDLGICQGNICGEPATDSVARSNPSSPQHCPSGGL